MRDIIKFKAYIKNLNWLLPVERINFDCKTVEVDLSGGGDTSEYGFDEIELLEYTEVKDNEGQELYENDIVRCYGGEFCQGYYEYDYICIIKKQLNNFDLVNKNRCGMGWGFVDNEYVIKLGDTYNNPELLKGWKLNNERD